MIHLRFKKIEGGGTALGCTRADGSITGQQLDAIRLEMSELFRQCDAVQPGQSLELEFPAELHASIHPHSE